MPHPSPRRSAAGFRFAGTPLLILALLLPPAGARPQGADAAPSRADVAQELEPALAEIQRVLRRARDPKGPAAADAALELAPFARSGLPVLLEILRARRVPAQGELGPQSLSEAQEEIVLQALAGLGRATVLAETQRLLAGGRTASARDAALRVLGRVGSALDVPELLGLPLAPEEAELRRSLSASFRAAVASLVQRDPESLMPLERLWHFQREPLLLPLIEGLGDAHDPRALVLLDEILVRHEHLLVPVMSQIQRVGAAPFREVNERIAQRLRHHLDPERPACRQAIFALATLRDYDSVLGLIELLDGTSSGLAKDAYHALRELTGLELRADPKLWEGWHRSELEWIDEHAPRVLALLRSSRHSDVAAAIDELARRRLYNDDWAIELAPVLYHHSPSLRLLAARALGALRSPYVIADLIDALDDPSADVKAASHRALRATTRRNLPPEAARWRAALLDTKS